MTLIHHVEPARWPSPRPMENVWPAEVIATCGLEPPAPLVEPAKGRGAAIRAARGPVKLVLRTLGFAAAGVGFVGVFVPLLPTTPFLLVASWAFLRASPELARRLHAHPLLGPYLREWEERRAIPRAVKVIGLASILASLAGLHHVVDPGWPSAVSGWALIAAAGYVGSRPSC